MTTLRVITAGSTPAHVLCSDPRCAACHVTRHDIQARRAACPACKGNPAACQAGTGEPNFNRLNGCTAFTDEGNVTGQPVPVTVTPLQPWQTRPARQRIAA